MGSGEAKPASQRKAPQGLYMYGGVGVGKTLLMDLLVTAAPPEFKVPTHLHTTCHHWLLILCVSCLLHVASQLLRACVA
jgi:predicted ATPase